MSAVSNADKLFGKSFIKLGGKRNYVAWAREFKQIASLNGISELYEGTEHVVVKPDLDEYTSNAPS